MRLILYEHKDIKVKQFIPKYTFTEIREYLNKLHWGFKAILYRTPEGNSKEAGHIIYIKATLYDTGCGNSPFRFFCSPFIAPNWQGLYDITEILKWKDRFDKQYSHKDIIFGNRF